MFLFSPAESEDLRNATRRQNRKIPDDAQPGTTQAKEESEEGQTQSLRHDELSPGH